MQIEAPARKDWRQHRHVLRSPPVPKRKNRFSRKHGIGEQQYAPTGSHPVIKRDVFWRTQGIRLDKNKHDIGSKDDVSFTRDQTIDGNDRFATFQNRQCPMLNALDAQVIG